MRIAFAYPGQGSLRAGMASAWRGRTEADVFERVGAIARLDDLAALADDPASGAQTAIAQPAIFAASLAAQRALDDAGIVADVVAGHSLGEVTAAVACGALTLGAGAQLVAERGRAMDAACDARPGTMAAILKLDIGKIEAIAADAGAAIANDNAPGQVVVSGTPLAVARVVDQAKDAGGRARPLDVEGAFHSPAMTPAVAGVETLVARLGLYDPGVPLVTGTTGDVLDSGAAIGRAIVAGILAPVRWRAVQERFAALGVEVVVEVGPGGVLTGLAKRAIPDIPVVAVGAPEDVPAVVEQLSMALAVSRL